MKHIPEDPKIQIFYWQGEKYPFVSFNTRPLETAMDFHVLRSLIYRDNEKDIPEALRSHEFLHKVSSFDSRNSKPLDNPVSFEYENTLYWETDCINRHFRRCGLHVEAYEPSSLEFENSVEYDADTIKTFVGWFKQRYEAHFQGRFVPKLPEPVPTECEISFNMKNDAQLLIDVLKRAKAIPDYMWLDDYERLLEKFYDYLGSYTSGHLIE